MEVVVCMSSCSRMGLRYHIRIEVVSTIQSPYEETVSHIKFLQISDSPNVHRHKIRLHLHHYFKKGYSLSLPHNVLLCFLSGITETATKSIQQEQYAWKLFDSSSVASEIRNLALSSATKTVRLSKKFLFYSLEQASCPRRACIFFSSISFKNYSLYISKLYRESFVMWTEVFSLENSPEIRTSMILLLASSGQNITSSIVFFTYKCEMEGQISAVVHKQQLEGFVSKDLLQRLQFNSLQLQRVIVRSPPSVSCPVGKNSVAYSSICDVSFLGFLLLSRPENHLAPARLSIFWHCETDQTLS